jgi:hypothetical protein
MSAAAVSGCARTTNEETTETQPQGQPRWASGEDGLAELTSHRGIDIETAALGDINGGLRFANSGAQLREQITTLEENGGGTVVLTDMVTIEDPLTVRRNGVYITGLGWKTGITPATEMSHLLEFGRSDRRFISRVGLRNLTLAGYGKVTDAFVRLRSTADAAFLRLMAHNHGDSNPGATVWDIRPSEDNGADMNFVTFRNHYYLDVAKAIRARGTATNRSFTDTVWELLHILRPSASTVLDIEDAQKSTFRQVYAGGKADEPLFDTVLGFSSPQKHTYANSIDGVFVEAIWPDADVTCVQVSRGTTPIEQFAIRRIAGFEANGRQFNNGTLVELDGAKHCYVNQLHGANIGQGNAGGAVVEDGYSNRIDTSGLKPEMASTHCTVGGHRSTINTMTHETGAGDRPTGMYSPGTLIEYTPEGSDETKLFVASFDGTPNAL